MISKVYRVLLKPPIGPLLAGAIATGLNLAFFRIMIDVVPEALLNYSNYYKVQIGPIQGDAPWIDSIVFYVGLTLLTVISSAFVALTHGQKRLLSAPIGTLIGLTTSAVWYCLSLHS